MISIADEIESLLLSGLSRDFLVAFSEEADAAMHEAWRRANEADRYDGKVKRAVLGHERHWNLERALERAAGRSGQEFTCASTKPAGGHYSLVRLNSWLVGRAVLVHPTYPLRPSKYRRMLAQMNRAASSLGTLFDPEAPVAAPQYGMLLTTPNRHQPERVARLMFGVPRADLAGWLYLEDIATLLAKFTSVEEFGVAPVEVVPDVAVPQIKKRLV